VVEHGAHRSLPVVLEGLAVQNTGAALAGPVEGDYVEAGVGEEPPDGEELLDDRVEPAEEHDRTSPLAGRRRETTGGQEAAIVGHAMARHGLVREAAVEQLDEPLVRVAFGG
jgi:hypothetical protein